MKGVWPFVSTLSAPRRTVAIAMQSGYQPTSSSADLEDEFSIKPPRKSRHGCVRNLLMLLCLEGLHLLVLLAWLAWIDGGAIWREQLGQSCMVSNPSTQLFAPGIPLTK